VTISPTIVIMKSYELSLSLGLGLLTWFILTRLLTIFPNKLIPQVTLELDGFLEIICGVREYGRICCCVKFVFQRVGLRCIGIFVEGFWWSLDITNLLSSLTTTLSNLL
jgi:hypothetical protein